jgi:glucose/arabinose dehydrogenase
MHWLRVLAILTVPALVVFSLFVLGAHSAPPAPTAPTVPPGFAANLFEGTSVKPMSLTFGPDGAVYIGDYTSNSVLRLYDSDGDGDADERNTYACCFHWPQGLAWRGNVLYVSYTNASGSNRGRVDRAEDLDGDHAADVITPTISGLPTGNPWHQNNGLTFGPDDKLYLTLGSTCNACIQTDPRSATILRYNPDGSAEEVYARGLRNSYDLTFIPNGDLFATDNGVDHINPPEELNYILHGAHYGWPWCYGDRVPDTTLSIPTPTPSLVEFCQSTEPMLAGFPSHTAATGITYYNGISFPPDYRNQLYLVTWRAPGWLYRVILVPNGGGYAATPLPFASGFAGPVDVVMGPDEALYVAAQGGDYPPGALPGAVWRIAAVTPTVVTPTPTPSHVAPSPTSTTILPSATPSPTVTAVESTTATPTSTATRTPTPTPTQSPSFELYLPLILNTP